MLNSSAGGDVNVMLSFLLTVALLLVRMYWLLVISTLRLMPDIGQLLIQEGSQISVHIVKEASREITQLTPRFITSS